MLAAFAVNFARFLVLGLEILIVGRVLVSWIDPAGRGPISAFLVSTTEPILGPVRRMLPRTGALDVSPLLVIILLGAVLRMVG
jgi:YggT family protein